jgi:hypothetical protein
VFPHPDTVYAVRDLERRRTGDQIARARAARLSAAWAAGPSARPDSPQLASFVRLVAGPARRLPLALLGARPGHRAFAH